ncbi:uncharacterized protein [Dermacentor andersoni]|uniref:uncharacterized protein n=1 Tax=Dermacentor andersoni TaxID=34620 RepID=UPI0024172650|nr:uncharacterized protein LOC126517092 [Dermacentor andersoni]
MKCCTASTRNSARRMGVAYAVVMLVVLAVQTGFMCNAAMECEANRRQYIWMSWGFSCFLSAAHVGFIVTWIVAAGTDNVGWMTICVTGVAVRLVGVVVYFTLKVTVDANTKQTIAEIYAKHFLHSEERISASDQLSPYPFAVLMALECWFLSEMNKYVDICTAAVTTREEKAEAERKSLSDSSAPVTAAKTSRSKLDN